MTSFMEIPSNMAASWSEKSSSVDKLDGTTTMDDSSDSEGEAEAAKSFHRRISTNKEIKTTVSTTETCLKVALFTINV